MKYNPLNAHDVLDFTHGISVFVFFVPICFRGDIGLDLLHLPGPVTQEELQGVTVRRRQRSAASSGAKEKQNMAIKLIQRAHNELHGHIWCGLVWV